MRKSKANKVKAERQPGAAALMADELDALATLMWGVAERLEYFSGFNGEGRKHAREMAGAALIARGWAKAIRKENIYEERT